MTRIGVGGETFDLDLYRDEAGNFVADAIGPLPRTRWGGAPPSPVARALATTREEALESVERMLERMYLAPVIRP